MSAYFLGGYLPRVGFRFSVSRARELFSYSLPIILASVPDYLITFGDRYFLQVHFGEDSVGVYSLGYRFGFILISLVWMPFMIFWEARQFELYKTGNPERQFGSIFLYVNMILLPAAFFISIASPMVIKILANESFWSAISIVPIILGAYVIHAWTEFCKFGLLQAKKTSHIAVITFFTMVVVMILYYYLIPRYQFRSEGSCILIDI